MNYIIYMCLHTINNAAQHDIKGKFLKIKNVYKAYKPFSLVMGIHKQKKKCRTLPIMDMNIIGQIGNKTKIYVSLEL